MWKTFAGLYMKLNSWGRALSSFDGIWLSFSRSKSLSVQKLYASSLIKNMTQRRTCYATRSVFAPTFTVLSLSLLLQSCAGLNQAGYNLPPLGKDGWLPYVTTLCCLAFDKALMYLTCLRGYRHLWHAVWASEYTFLPCRKRETPVCSMKKIYIILYPSVGINILVKTVWYVYVSYLEPIQSKHGNIPLIRRQTLQLQAMIVESLHMCCLLCEKKGTWIMIFWRSGIEFGATSVRFFTDIFKHVTTFDWNERACCEEESGTDLVV